MADNKPVNSGPKTAADCKAEFERKVNEALNSALWAGTKTLFGVAVGVYGVSQVFIQFTWGGLLIAIGGLIITVDESTSGLNNYADAIKKAKEEYEQCLILINEGQAPE